MPITALGSETDGSSHLVVDPSTLGQMGLQILNAAAFGQCHYPPLDPGKPTFIIGCRDASIVGIVKASLMRAYPENHPATVITRAPTGGMPSQEMALAEVDLYPEFSDATDLYLPPLAPGGSIMDLLNVMARLRAAGGCPWDRKQTHESLRPYLLEETYEVLEALDEGDMQELAAELGDLLLQIVFHVQIATEESQFRMADVTRGIVTKLWRRHPHVFGEISVNGVGDVLRNWEAIKARERLLNSKQKKEKGPLSGVARGLPALAQAETYLSRAERLKITHPADVETALGLLLAPDSTSDSEEKLGQALLVLTNWARQRGLDAESALRAANARLAATVEKSVQEAEIAQLAD